MNGSFNPQLVLEQFAAGFAVPQIDSQTLLSMEIFCSSSLEASDRAAFPADGAGRTLDRGGRLGERHDFPAPQQPDQAGLVVAG
jgi:hypothetical protein